MRIALVSPYSWTLPGGVTRHIEALASEFWPRGHDVRVLAPFDPPDRLSARHASRRPARGARAARLARPAGAHDRLAVQRRRLEPRAHTPYAITRAAPRAARAARFDVVHVHEPVAPCVGWDALTSQRRPARRHVPLLLRERGLQRRSPTRFGARRRLNRLNVRIAVSEAAAWTGGASTAARYRVIPNGVDVPAELPRPAPRPTGRAAADRLRRPGRRAQGPARAAARLRGAARARPRRADDRRRRPRGGRAAAARRHAGRHRAGQGLRRREGAPRCAAADVLVAPVAGRRELRHGADRGLRRRHAGRRLRHRRLPRRRRATASTASSSRAATPPRWPRRCATSRGARAPRRDGRRRARARASATPGRRSPARSWRPTRTRSPCRAAGERARSAPAVRLGAVPADSAASPAARRLPSLEPPKRRGPRSPPRGRPQGRHGARRARRRVRSALLALQRIGLDQIGASLLRATPTWVLLGLGLMCASMVVRAVAWHAILRAALPEARLRARDALQGTFIGVLMSATLPARLGEPSRALIVARRTGRPREHLPTVLGTIVSQTLLNVVALIVLGIVMFSHRRPLQPAPARPGRLRARAAGRARRRPRAARAPARRRALALAPRAGGGAPRRAPRSPRCAPACASSARPSSAPRRPRCSSARGSSSGCRATCCSSRSGSTTAPGIGAAAAVLFAVNVTAVLPATPSNLGVFQAACVAVLAGAYGVGQGRRAGLRDHPAGRRDRDRRGHGRARAGQGGHELARRAPARPARRPVQLDPLPASAREPTAAEA